MYTELLKLNNDKINRPISNLPKDLNRYFIKEEKQIALK
jgi:hypothetical protein